MVSPAIHLSVVIPAYNERARIGATLDGFIAYLDAQPYDWEIIVVDDGSTDGAAAFVEENYASVTVIAVRPNRGKGHAVKTGMLAARGAHRLFSDADASTPIKQIETFWPHIAAGADIVIGSRDIAGARVEVHQAWYRENMGKLFNLFLRVLGLTRFHDTQCGFKLFTARAAEIVFPRQTIERFGFDAEVLHIARRQGLRVVEAPVRWINSPHSKVNPVADSARMIAESLRVRWNDLLGRYR